MNTFPRNAGNNPTTKNLKLARRSAARMRAISACPPCKSIKQRCDNLRPCSRCKRIGREARCLASQDEETNDTFADNSSIDVERPMNNSIHILELSNDELVPSNLVLKYQWSQATVMRYWKSGYRCNELVTLFNSLPNPLPSLMDTIFSSLAPKHQIQNGDSTVLPPSAPFADPHCYETAFWESEQEYGCIEISFDPVTGQRKRIFMNPRFATIFGFHREELVFTSQK